MFDPVDIFIGVVILIIIIAFFIDSYKFSKKIEKQRKERNAERIKQGREPIDYDKPIGGSYCSSDSEATDNFRSDIFRNMGMMG